MSSRVRLFTIGFTATSAERFFSRLQDNGVRRVVDVRLNNVSQLAGFAKKADLAWFLRTIAAIDYAHVPELAPTPELLGDWRSRAIDWTEYERRFRTLMDERRVQDLLAPAQIDGACLVCSEPDAAHCHRRLVAEHLDRAWGGLDVVHL
jgi:uncharacterized protein (DUF488 family)